MNAFMNQTHPTVRKAILFGVLAATSHFSFASETSPANEVVSVFDGVCFLTRADPLMIARIARTSQAKPIPKNVLNSDPVIAATGGQGFLFTRGKKQFVVAAAKGGGCSVMANRIDSVAVEKAVTEAYSLEPARTEISGTQTQHLWTVTAPSGQKGSVIMLTIPKKGFGMDDVVTLGYVPAAIVEKLK